MKILLSLFGIFSYMFSFGQATVGQWEFKYPVHQLQEIPLLDLRSLNEKVAGEHGFIRLSDDGNSFVRGDGKPIRFWPVNEAALSLSDSSLAEHAHFLARMGVNMCRYHVSVNAKGKGTSLYDFDMDVIHDVWRFVAAMKKEGIYSTISPFWPHNGFIGGWVPEEWGIDGYSGTDDLWGCFFFNDTLREGYKNWVRALYTLKNPYTGLSLNDDPAVAICQFMNEDGVFFWTMQFIKPELKALVSKKFVSWLEKTYGSVDKAFDAWGPAKLPLDNSEIPFVDLYPTYELTIQQDGSKALRIRDQVNFFAETQRDVYEELYSFYKEELGCRQLMNAMNWTTASPSRLHDLDRWTCEAADVLALNRYYEPAHFGENNGWRIDPGHFYVGSSALLTPSKLPLNVKQADNHPFIITESGWNTPQRYMAEGPFLISVYQSLTGIDGFYWFCITDENYSLNPYFSWINLVDGQHPMNRWTCSLPGILSQFPANSLVYRLGYLKEGETVINEMKSYESLIGRKVSAIYEGRNFDPNRDYSYDAVQANANAEISPLTFLTGPVKVTYGSETDKTTVDPRLNELVNEKNSTISGITGEETLDFAKGICEVNTPNAKGICGFLSKKENFTFDNVRIKSKNEYASVWITSLDSLPLTQSSRILIQCGTKYTPSDWKEEPAEYTSEGQVLKGFRIISTGRMPWLADKTLLTVEIKNKNLSSAVILDEAGYFSKEIPVRKNGNWITIILPENTLYVIIK
jgi:hypothetical protein